MDLLILAHAWPFIAQGHNKYNVTHGSTSGPRVVGSLRTRVLPGCVA
jgi:hypothetical protein